MKIEKVILFVLIISTLASCKVLMTEQIRTNVENQGIPLDKIQYYNSKKIEFTRVLTSSEAELTSGKVKFQNGEYIEIIKIKNRTPGRCDSFSDNKLAVSFEFGENRQLIFENNNLRDSLSTYTFKPDNCNTAIQTYTITDDTGTERQEEKETNVCTVQYDGNVYSVKYFSKPELLIKKKQINKKEINKRTAKGIKVN